ncbi:phosphonate ABC transporter ATP-binding protein [Metamycoplasma spumans]|uniref:phosphonate ABC transporter ATP-binding protein n=1 Tax=Metamycoplasma spumans TaxID=92406 RepID=UPI0034DCCC6D
MNQLEFKNVFATYKKNHDLVLQDVSFKIKKGEMVAIIGKSGAGKSTIFNAILKQLKITSGDIFLNGSSYKKMTNKQWKKELANIGFLSQQPNLIEDLNVYENILHFYTKYKNFIYSWVKILTKNQKHEIYQTLDKLGIFDKSFTRVSELSGGQKQRVEIAKLLLQDVSIILADEPTSNLDIINAEEVLSLLIKIQKENQTTILVNIHDLSLIKKFFKKYIYVENGKILNIGDTDLLTENDLKKIYQE